MLLRFIRKITKKNVTNTLFVDCSEWQYSRLSLSIHPLPLSPYLVDSSLSLLPPHHPTPPVPLSSLAVVHWVRRGPSLYLYVLLLCALYRPNRKDTGQGSERNQRKTAWCCSSRPSRNLSSYGGSCPLAFPFTPSSSPAAIESRGVQYVIL